MTWLTDMVRYVDVLGDPRLAPNTIDGLPPHAVQEALDTLLHDGWIKTFEYDKDDAWIDYARVDLRRGRSKLRVQWDPENGGSVEGPRAALDDLHVLEPWMDLQQVH
jgi:hypothetical protein